MRYLTVAELIAIHEMILAQTGGSPGIRDHGTLQSAAAQPMMTWSGQDLYPSLEEKAAALCYSLVCNHPFVDGNKRISHAAMEIFLQLKAAKFTPPLTMQNRSCCGWRPVRRLARNCWSGFAIILSEAE